MNMDVTFCIVIYVANDFPFEVFPLRNIVFFTSKLCDY